MIEFRETRGCLILPRDARRGPRPITVEAPHKAAAPGHDRRSVPIRRENVDAWLNPDPANLAALHAILDDRERPYYEHRLAA
jgi:putative SOS response-associated peptidase YedK